ncbi:hypothetical protein CGCF415_v008482 [Colletotrichum fructicola]|uniref:Uncharacterized protein n=2 Tax=Colletotrichum fructicola (strain Nara gc5) TaxID=1213859 RepID=A0A7J6INN8_COLFN|nr:uncharacterized protein CGMCC3_g13739 [Colletotrichum fructicola]KAF4478389.1 hypothetical protein CGGC5_v014200 [Colletotrichum fructicola Nara gc5]KAI8286708.1 hypothetical protein K4K60_000223 [Colletotrichum sp. SAR11_57]KAE9570221.1 hypothetical protein CGMCC3_g13739 [Colletotrichum fructicola]KAF4421620.1 hypothetical protein CFRS1_v013948 [Colletotrichum fructicola]KAF4888984.1 hypothetical protein CGCFRS4_v009570 [Colletotrichum fructicola]
MAPTTINDLPQEIVNAIVSEIIDEHTYGLSDIEDISGIVPVCHKFMSAVKDIARRQHQKLENKLGTYLLSSIYNDALAAISFPSFAKLNSLATDEEKKKSMKEHLTNWQSLELFMTCTRSPTQQLGVCHFIDKTIIPFAEDFALKTSDLDAKDFQMRLPEWAESSLKGAYQPLVLEVPAITSYHPNESRRILRAFCRFELLSHVFRARPGLQLWDLKAQHELLDAYFDQHEMEEVLCVSQYVNDLHVYLFRAFMSANDGRDVQEDFRQVCRAFKPVNGVWKIPDRYNITRSDSGERIWYATHVHDETVTRIDKIQFLDTMTQSTVIKQISTFGLGFLRSFLASPIQEYRQWMVKYADIILKDICTAEVEHVGAESNWTWANHYGKFCPEDPVITIPGRVSCECERDSPNTAWKVLGHGGSVKTLLGFRRCGWVFWSDERLRARRFWAIRDINPYQRDIDMDAAENQWINAPLPDVLLEDLSFSDAFRFAVRELSSLADWKLHKFCKDSETMLNRWRCDFVSDLRARCVAVVTFDELFGPLVPPDLPLPVEVAPGIFWG